MKQQAKFIIWMKNRKWGWQHEQKYQILCLEPASEIKLVTGVVEFSVSLFSSDQIICGFRMKFSWDHWQTSMLRSFHTRVVFPPELCTQWIFFLVEGNCERSTSEQSEDQKSALYPVACIRAGLLCAECCCLSSARRLQVSSVCSCYPSYPSPSVHLHQVHFHFIRDLRGSKRSMFQSHCPPCNHYTSISDLSP